MSNELRPQDISSGDHIQANISDNATDVIVGNNNTLVNNIVNSSEQTLFIRQIEARQ